MTLSTRTLLASLLVLLLTTGPALGIGDFGDAPDHDSSPFPGGSAPSGIFAGYGIPFELVEGKFPTKLSTTNSRFGAPGGHALDPSDC